MTQKTKPSVLIPDGPSLRTHDLMSVEWSQRRHLMAIDPGLQGTGVACWFEGCLRAADVIEVPPKLRSWSWPARADFIVDALLSYIPDGLRDRQDDCCVVSEFPEGFGGVKMMAWKTGDLQRLTYLVGLISGRVAPAKFVPVLVHNWKGQLPKHVVEERIRKRVPRTTLKELNPQLHAWDAIGIGLWARGEF